MPGRGDFSADDEKLIARAEKAGASFEENNHGWGFFNAGDKALKIIAKIPGIRFLDLFEACEAGDATDEGLNFIKDMSDLRYLALGPGISDVGLANVAALTDLLELRLDSAGDITDAGMGALSKLAKLETLSIQYTDVTSAGVLLLKGLKHLEELNLEGTAVTQETVDDLRQALPKCKIIWDAALRVVKKPAATRTVAASSIQLKLQTTLRGHGNKADHAAFTPDGALLGIVAANKAVIWETPSATKRCTINLKRGELLGAAFTPDGGTFASGSSVNSVFLWNTAGKQVARLQTTNQVFTRVAIDSKGKHLAAGGQDGKLYLWDLETRELRAAIKATSSNFFFRFAFSPDGSSIATSARESSIFLWGLPSGEKKQEFQGPPHKTRYECIGAIAFSPDGTHLAAAHPDKRIRFWNIASGAEVKSLANPLPTTCIAFHSSGRFLATGSEGDTIVRLWDLTTSEIAGEFETNADWDRVNFVAFSPTSPMLATNGKGNSVLLLHVQATGS